MIRALLCVAVLVGTVPAAVRAREQRHDGQIVVSMATVKTHINHVLAKTGSRDRAALVAFACTHQMIAP